MFQLNRLALETLVNQQILVDPVNPGNPLPLSALVRLALLKLLDHRASLRIRADHSDPVGLEILVHRGIQRVPILLRVLQAQTVLGFHLPLVTPGAL